MSKKKANSRPVGNRNSPTRFHMAYKKRSKTAGLPPGTMVHVGKQQTEKARICIVDYDETKFTEMCANNESELPVLLDKVSAPWINVDGLHEIDVIGNIGGYFGLHPLVLEDIVNTAQRPKVEDLGDYLFIVLRMANYDEQSEEICLEQISLVVGPSWLLSFQEGARDNFIALRDRMRTGIGRLRKSGKDYLAYALIDTVVDQYFVIMEKLAEKIEFLEEEVVTNPTPDTLQTIHKLKTDMIFLRKSVWPLREGINKLVGMESALIQASTRPYLRDVYDHTIHVIDTMESFRDVVSGMLDIYLSSVSYRLNEIMKVLTIIATTFIPLTFLAGWYGMNFKNMPELDSRWGYPSVIVMACIIALGMLTFFRSRKWL